MSKKKYKFNPDDYILAIVGAVIIVLGGLLLTDWGRNRPLTLLFEGIGAIGVICGFFIASVAGVIGVIFVMWIVLKLVETFSTPVGIGLILLGVGIIIYWIKDNLRIIDTKPRSQSKPSSTATSSAKPAELSWNEYKNRTDLANSFWTAEIQMASGLLF